MTLLRPYNLPNNHYIGFRLKQLANEYPEQFHDAMIGYHHFVPDMKVLNRHILNLQNTYGKLNVLSYYMNELRFKKAI